MCLFLVEQQAVTCIMEARVVYIDSPYQTKHFIQRTMSKFRRLVFQILTKWGEYSNDVQFILQWSSFDGMKQELPARLKIADTQHGFSHGPTSPPATPHDAMSPPDRNKDIRKSLTFSGGHLVGRTGDNVGVVKARPRLEV